MKTCSFRGAEPRSVVEGLFCGNGEPDPRYRMTPCGQELCRCCHPLNADKRRIRWSVIDFDSTSKHHFGKEYTTYLNCPAVSVRLCLCW
jgi:hypothetical protein